ncbi:MAG: hypothetical protein A4E65_02440 [Syntrophorhabdus sp. PtaU1.Bin153]|nr:MAG: hypothetical protein A4E65_02440 [Syntrophorhabdus sp. PtaU1.Bin153]
MLGEDIMRNMSFALTIDQILAGTKTVTRRLGWLWLIGKTGVLIQPVRKNMGLKKGEHVLKLRDPIMVVNARREPLRWMEDDTVYGYTECAKEGFGWHPDYKHPSAFINMFCATHKGCTPETEITRIEFVYDYEEVKLPMK